MLITGGVISLRLSREGRVIQSIGGVRIGSLQTRREVGIGNKQKHVLYHDTTFRPRFYHVLRWSLSGYRSGTVKLYYYLGLSNYPRDETSRCPASCIDFIWISVLKMV